MSQPDPFDRFREVFEEACATEMANPNAMVVSSVAADGRPSSRVVLLKDFDPRGFVFYTNFESRKGREILAHRHVCLSFFWRQLDKQVRIEGEAIRVDDEEADAYFASRPHGAQLGAWASRQSRPLKNRAELVAEVAKVKARFPIKVSRPPHWSGFRVVPSYFEFWVAGQFRLHDRTVFEKSVDGWTTHKLFP